jgi:type I restriction enzyme S subunit
LIRLKTTTKSVRPEFLYFWTQSRKYWIQVNKNREGQLKTGLNARVLATLRLYLPPLSEQKKIAEILSTVDEAIEKVKQAIEKIEKVKKGSMQKLLTKGIGHKEFKETEIGRIPKSWNTVKLVDITIKTEKVDPAKENLKAFKYLDISSINNLTNKITNITTIEGNNAPSRARKLIKYGDVIFATTRPYLKNIAFVTQELDNQICSTGFCVLRPITSCVISEWIFYNALTKKFVSKVSSKMKGATYPAVTDNDVLNEKIPLPPLAEQKNIAEILNTVDTRLDLLRRKKRGLERVKKGLMNELLTGKKRVKVEA